MPNMNQIKTLETEHEARRRRRFWYGVVTFIWVFLGIFAYVSAFGCTHERYTGSDARKVGMLLLAMVLGPLYWLVYPFARADGYCKLK